MNISSSTIQLQGSRQRGAVLMISLIMLLLLTIIGITAMQTTTMEEKMAGNTRDQTVAFEAASAALRDAESYIEGTPNTASFDGSGGLYAETDTVPSYDASGAWTTANARQYAGTLPDASNGGVATPPMYMVQIVTTSSSPAISSKNIGGYGQQNPGSKVTVFRITARGTGGTDNSQVFLQELYGKAY